MPTMTLPSQTLAIFILVSAEAPSKVLSEENFVEPGRAVI
jgi:hypothetical protein